MKNEFSFKSRLMNISKMQTGEFDLVVVGGGITGAGVARDAASRGLRVALVEARDYAEGTSSRSSKLIHGGIRYLENLEFGLVFEALSERQLLFEMAPHLVHPLRFVLPVYSNSRVGMFKLGLGMWLYDILSLFQAPEMHERISADQASYRLPMLNQKGIQGAYVYSDAYMDDDRLVVETLRSAHQKGAVCANYLEAKSAHHKDGKVVALDCWDHLSGKAITIKGKHFVSSVGPWTDIFASSLWENWRKILRPSKGVHLTLDRSRLPLKQAVVMAEGERIVFGIPRHEMVIIGTTDTDYTDVPENVKSDLEDVEYILEVTNQYFPEAQLTKQDILASYAGVRPLVDDGSETEGKTSREHIIIQDPRNFTIVAGGKYTTYRHMAEETVDLVLQAFDLESQSRFKKSDTKTPLNPLVTEDTLLWANGCVEEWAEKYRLSESEVRQCVERHGAEAETLLEKVQPYLNFKEGDRLWLAEAEFAIECTMCMCIKDFYLRRSPLFLAYKDHGLSLLDPIGDIFAKKLNWDRETKEYSVAALRQHIQQELAWQQS